MFHDFLDPHWPTFAIAAFVQFILFVRWIYRRVRNDEIMRVFVEDMATSHLPHISNYSRESAMRRESSTKRIRRYGGWILNEPASTRWKAEINGAPVATLFSIDGFGA